MDIVGLTNIVDGVLYIKFENKRFKMQPYDVVCIVGDHGQQLEVTCDYLIKHKMDNWSVLVDHVTYRELKVS